MIFSPQPLPPNWLLHINTEVPSQRPPDKPKKTWRKCVEEDLATLSAEEEAAHD